MEIEVQMLWAKWGKLSEAVGIELIPSKME